jgi:hypothetical protein
MQDLHRTGELVETLEKIDFDLLDFLSVEHLKAENTESFLA